MKRWVLGFLILISFLINPFYCFATEPSETCPDNYLIFSTGNPQNTYAKMFKNISAYYPNLCENSNTTGGFDNILNILRRNADVGLAQSDTIDIVQRTDSMVTKNIRSLMSLHANTMHIIVLRNGILLKEGSEGFLGYGSSKEQRQIIVDMRDLRGKKVAVLGSALPTSTIINERLQLSIDAIEVFKPEEGISKLQNNEVVAFLAMGGKPLSWVEKLDGKMFNLAAFDPSDIQRLGNFYIPTKVSYKNLGLFGLPCLSVQNELFVWNYKGKRAADLIALKNAIIENLEEIKEDRASHPAWQEVEDPEKVSWIKYEVPLK